MFSSALIVSLLPALTAAFSLPSYNGLSTVWHDDFWGNAGDSPNVTHWNVITGDLGLNNELETYTESNENLQISGGGTLQLIPRRNSSTSSGWTSARIESVDSYTPVPGKNTRSMREGTSWPLCGELDILEQVNGKLTGYGTAHCENHCEEPTGRQGYTSIPSGSNFHTWRLDWDRTSNNWQTESITWSLDGVDFFSINGTTIGDQATWSTLAHSPFYILLNVAVGGTMAGNPDSNTLDGYDSMMEVAYVAVYSS
ncbi:beta-glucanase [Grosmannia clavigera kw1407]|uniref:Beta-glucanase n=1 Tax=Grosmannia clavigera (strain kw1407 / UAMH 11150) TaxID=655863 RepID=F0XDM7_GROCL|nr:beta-glucanase [Grosmannia clavigera kw1407]EFX04547.1 beta-glucanase [Grosmannia clavigera kw1407]